jgi:hypothetical protein
MEIPTLYIEDVERLPIVTKKTTGITMDIIKLFFGLPPETIKAIGTCVKELFHGVKEVVHEICDGTAKNSKACGESVATVIQAWNGNKSSFTISEVKKDNVNLSNDPKDREEL